MRNLNIMHKCNIRCQHRTIFCVRNNIIRSSEKKVYIQSNSNETNQKSKTFSTQYKRIYGYPRFAATSFKYRIDKQPELGAIL